MRFSLRSTGPKPGVSFGGLRGLTPITRGFGYSRGTPVDRVFIEAFLEQNRLAIHGRVLEVGDDSYTRRFGGPQVRMSDVLHVQQGHPKATIVADLAAADHIASNAFDCIICTQTLQLVFDLQQAVATLHRILKPGGTLLLTVPGISHVDDVEWAASWYWSMTPLAARTLFGREFCGGHVEVEASGNVLTAVAFLHGLAAEDLTPSELAHKDPAYPMLVTVKAIKALSQGDDTPGARGSGTQAEPPSVAIIICCFNQGHFLGDAIESALGQVDAACEIVVIDDGSSDNTPEVTARYRDWGVSYVWQTNAGLAAARNSGLSHTGAAHVIFLDADDRLRPDAASQGLRVLARRPECAFVSGHHHLIGIDGTVLQHLPRPPVSGSRYRLLLEGNYISMCSAVMFRRSALTSVGGFDPRLRAAEDYDIYLRLTRRYPACEHDAVVAEYRRHGAALTDDPLQMLGWVLRVLRAQKPFVRDDPQFASAWRSGYRRWQDYYGRLAAERLSAKIGPGGGVRRRLMEGFHLARMAPASLRWLWPGMSSRSG